MTTWNHRVLRHPDGGLSIHEVFYNDDGTNGGWTKFPVEPYGETLDELRTDLQRMLACLDLPIIEPPA